MGSRQEIAAPPEEPNLVWRTLVSLLLFLHFFAMAVTVAANFQPVSRLRAFCGSKLFFVRRHLEVLNMDLAYNFHLTYGELEDVDHQLVAELPPAAGQTEPVIVELPAANLRPGIRRRRLSGLGFFIADRAEDDATGGLLPKSVGARLLREHDAQELTLRSRAHLVLRSEDALATDSAQSNPNAPRLFMERYAARVWRDGDDYQVYKIESQRDTAPVAAPGPGAGGQGPGGLRPGEFGPAGQFPEVQRPGDFNPGDNF